MQAATLDSGKLKKSGFASTPDPAPVQGEGSSSDSTKLKLSHGRRGSMAESHGRDEVLHSEQRPRRGSLTDSPYRGAEGLAQKRPGSSNSSNSSSANSSSIASSNSSSSASDNSNSNSSNSSVLAVSKKTSPKKLTVRDLVVRVKRRLSSPVGKITPLDLGAHRTSTPSAPRLSPLSVLSPQAQYRAIGHSFSPAKGEPLDSESSDSIALPKIAPWVSLSPSPSRSPLPLPSPAGEARPLERRHSSPVLLDYRRAPDEPQVIINIWKNVLVLLGSDVRFKVLELALEITRFSLQLDHEAPDRESLDACFRALMNAVKQNAGDGGIKAHSGLRFQLSQLKGAIQCMPDELPEPYRMEISASALKFNAWAAKG